MKVLRRVAFSLIVGALFGWALSTKFPPHVTAISGVAAGAFMYVAFIYNDRIERREAVRRAEDEDQDQDQDA